jgi:hypothetical protein
VGGHRWEDMGQRLVPSKSARPYPNNNHQKIIKSKQVMKIYFFLIPCMYNLF